MSIDSDISAALPEPPPPRPARRDAAIEAALQRFDGGAAPDRPRAATPASWRGRIVRPHLAALATVALVALIGLPVWMSGNHQFNDATWEAPARPVSNSGPNTNPSPSPGPVATAVNSPAAAALADGRALAPAPTVAAISPPVVSPKAEPALADSSPGFVADSSSARCAFNCAAPADALRVDAREVANRTGYYAPQAQAVQDKRLDKDVAAAPQNRAELGYAAPSPPPAAVAPPPPGIARSPVVAGQLAEQGILGGADIAVTGARVSKSYGADLVVTGQRRSAAKPAPHGDWNACTVDDPRQRLGACRTLVNPAAPGAAGRAAAHVANGLSLAWRDDLDGAIAAFDQAVAISPRLSFAYLNRGLAYAHKGELDRALDDLNRAVRYAPDVARNYYSRSLLWRQRGDAKRAEADQARAIALDR